MEPDQIQVDLTGQSSSDPVENPDSLANPFLNGVDEADREIVGKYINDWDAQVTQKFQSLNDELKPWKEMGADHTQVKQAIETLKWADSDPLAFFEAAKGQLIEMGLLDDDNTGQRGDTVLPEFEGMPEGAINKFQTLEAQVSKMSEYIEKLEADNQRKSNQQLLDETLSTLQNEHGPFDEDAVLGRIVSKGMTPEEAVKDYQKTLKSLNSPEKPTPPPTLLSGRTGTDQVDASKIKGDPKARKNLVAELLSQVKD